MPPAETTKRHLDASIGYLGLGMAIEAWNELEQVVPEQRAHPDVLGARIEVCRALEKWDLMAEIAAYLQKLQPEDVGHVIDLAFATRRLQNELAAAGILEGVRDRFPQEPLIPYNLACYRAVAGQIEEAKILLKQAILLDADLRVMALDDPDLEGIWDTL